MAAAEILLTEDQRLEFTQIPQNISELEIFLFHRKFMTTSLL